MRRKLLIGLLTLGTIGGFASGVCSVKHAAARRAAFERHVANVCVEAANGVHKPPRASPGPGHP